MALGTTIALIKALGNEIEADVLKVYPTDTATGVIANFPDGAALPAKNISVAIEPVQSGSGDPSPDNVRPISGWTDAHITVSPTTNAQDGTTYTVTFPNEAGTVYGGTLDVTNGTLTVSWAFMGPEQLSREAMLWQMNNNGTNIFECYTEKILKANGASNIISNCLKNISSYSDVAGYTIRAYAASNKVAIGVPKSVVGSQTPVANFRRFLSDNNVSVCYELATPVTYTLTPQQIQLLLGTNNVWADTGDSIVNYYADTTLYIKKLTGSTEQDMIADSAISSGKYFLVGNRLFLSTTSIAAGAKLTPGTNCTETNLAAALNAINS